jgi:ribosomal protein L32
MAVPTHRTPRTGHEKVIPRRTFTHCGLYRDRQVIEPR